MPKRIRPDLDVVLIGVDRKPAVWLTYFNARNKKIKYVVRAGRKGKGRVLAEARCLWGCISQKKATDEIARVLGGIRFLDDLEAEKKY